MRNSRRSIVTAVAGGLLVMASIANAGHIDGPGTGSVLAALVATPTAEIAKEILGQGSSAVAPDRVLLLQRRTFAPGSDSGPHPAPGPTVLVVDSGAIEFRVSSGIAVVTRAGAAEPELAGEGDMVTVGEGDALFYDEGVVHQVVNRGTDPAVTLESRLNPIEEAPATP